MKNGRTPCHLLSAAIFVAACAAQPAPEPAPPVAPETTRAAAAVETSGSISDPAAADPRPLAEGEAPPTGGAAVGDLLVVPTRVVFEGAERTAEVTLVNIGAGPGTYRISLVDYEMTAAGGLTSVEPENNPRSAAAMIRYSPRQVTLPPRHTQTVRLQLRRPAEAAEAEYRSHLLFQSVPTPVAREETVSEEPVEGVRIELRPIFGITIPVIVRQPGASSGASIRDVSLVRDKDQVGLDLTLARTGTGSVYGRLEATWVPDAGGPQRVVGMISGIAVYPPLPSRLVRLPLTLDESFRGSGRIDVAFISEEGDDRRVLARHSLEIR